MGLITITKSKVPTPTTAPEIQAASATSSEPATVAEPMLTASATPDIATPDAITSQAPVRRKRVRGKRLRQASVDPEPRSKRRATDYPEAHAKTAQMTVGSKLEPFYTVADLAERWKVSERHVRRLIDSGALKVSRIGKAIRIPAANVSLYEAIAGI